MKKYLRLLGLLAILGLFVTGQSGCTGCGTSGGCIEGILFLPLRRDDNSQLLW